MPIGFSCCGVVLHAASKAKGMVAVMSLYMIIVPNFEAVMISQMDVIQMFVIGN